MKTIAATLAIAFCFVSTPALADKAADAPKVGKHKDIKADSPLGRVQASLKLIKAGKYGKWVKSQCHKELLCYNANSIASLKKYNLPAITRLLKNPKTSCLKAGDSLEVTRVKPYKHGRVEGGWQMYVRCSEQGMPKPFYVIKQGTEWRIPKI